MLNENNTKISHVFLKSQIDYHKEIAPFARRPLTTFLMDSTTNVLGLRAGHAFILVNFFLLFVSGILIHRLSENLKATRKQAMVNMLVYFSSFSIIFAFFPPVFTYDEPLQYCFILASIIAFLQQRWLVYVALFTMALVTRETSMLILPAFALFISEGRFENEKTRFSTTLSKRLIALSPLLFYGAFIGIYLWQNQLLDATKTEMASRYTCFLENFESVKNTVESLTSIFLSLGPFLYLSFLQIGKNYRSGFEKRFLFAFLLTVAINTPIVILTAFARESRLFALPLLFLWPMFMQLFGSELSFFRSTRHFKRLFEKWPHSVVFVVLNLLNYWFCFVFYKGLGLGENTFFAEYLFLLNLCLISHFTYSLVTFPEPNDKNRLS